MKKIISLLLCLMLLFSLCYNCFAETASEIQEIFLEKNKEELEAVKRTIELNNQDKSNRAIDINSLDFNKAYRLYFLDDGDIVKAFEEKGSFGANITDKYCWIIPYTDVSAGELEVVRSDNSETGWALRVDTDFQVKMSQNYDNVDSSITGILNLLLNSVGKADLSSIKLFSSKQFKCRLLYFTDNGEEYIVPYFAEPVEGVTTAKVYKAADFVDAARTHLYSTEETEENENETNGRFDKIFIAYLTVGTVVVLVFVLLVVFIKNKRPKEETQKDEGKNNIK